MTEDRKTPAAAPLFEEWKMATSQTIPAYEFWQATEVDATFGAGLDRYVDRSDTSDIEQALRKEADVAKSLFYRGGRLADHDLKWRSDLGGKHPFLTLQALLCSFAPSHEAKMATAALALHHWCEPISEPSA